LKRLADTLGVTSDYLLDGTTDYLLDGTTDQAAKARFADRQLLEQFQAVERLPDHDKALVKSFLDASLFKRKVEGMTAR